MLQDSQVPKENLDNGFINQKLFTHSKSPAKHQLLWTFPISLTLTRKTTFS